MYDDPIKSLFEMSIILVGNAIKNQNKDLIFSYEKNLKIWVGLHCSLVIVSCAILQLLETDPEGINWALENYRPIKFYKQLIEELTLNTTQKLIQNGFVLGQDFSVVNSGKIFIKERAKTALIEKTSFPESVLLQKILLVPNAVD